MPSLAEQLMLQQTPQPLDKQLESAATAGIGLAQAQEQLQSMRDKNQDNKNKLLKFESDFHMKHQSSIITAKDDAAAKRMVKRYQGLAQRHGYVLSEEFIEDFVGNRESLKSDWARAVEHLKNIDPSTAAGRQALAEYVQMQSGPFEHFAKSYQDVVKMVYEQEGRERVAALKTEAETASELNKERTKALKDWGTSKFVVTKLEQLSEVDNAYRQIMSGNPIAASVVRIQLARIAGEVGRLSNQDIEMFSGSRSLRDRAQQLRETLLTGNLSPANRAYMKEIVEMAAKAHRISLIRDAKSFARASAMANPNFDTGNLEQIMLQRVAGSLGDSVPIGGEFMDDMQAKITKESAPTDKAAAPMPQEKEQEFMRKAIEAKIDPVDFARAFEMRTGSPPPEKMVNEVKRNWDAYTKNIEETQLKLEFLADRVGTQGDIDVQTEAKALLGRELNQEELDRFFALLQERKKAESTPEQKRTPQGTNVRLKVKGP